MHRSRWISVAVWALAGIAHAQFPTSTPDPAAADRGAKLYGTACARCHGADARGKADAPDLLRSLDVLHDRREMLHGRELAPLMKSLPGHDFHYSAAQYDDLSQFLVRTINGILRSGYSNQPTELTSGDAAAGQAFFNGAGGCTQCHSVTGNLKGIGSRYTPAALQQKFLFPNSGIGTRAKVQVTVKQPGGKTSTGDLLRIDDFTVALRDASGQYRSFNRTAGVTVTTTDPYAAHNALLDRYTDADIHNLTTYLVTLK